MNILVLIPVKKNLNHMLKQHVVGMMEALAFANVEHSFDIVFDGRGAGDTDIQNHQMRCDHMAGIRQSMIDELLQSDHDGVFWFDADIIKFPLDLPSQLISRSGGGIGAPLVMLDKHHERLYDIAGFIENGKWAKIDPPWFAQSGPVYELDSVGACYFVPADVYKAGAKHVAMHGFTEHWSVCQKAKEIGLPVRAFGDLRAIHADLREFGESWH